MSRAPVVAALRARPRHLVLWALVLGLLSGAGPPVVTLAAALGTALLAGRARPAGLAALAVLGGAELADARREARGRTELGPALGAHAAARLVLLEAPRTSPWGERRALARLVTGVGREGRGAGERVVLRGPRSRGATDSGRTPARRRGRAPPATAEGWPARPVGAEVRAQGELRRLEEGEGWLARRGARGVLEAGALRATGLRRGGAAGVLDRLRERVEDTLTARLPAREGALLRGMALGQDEALDARTREDFRAAGLAHVVAASGQNVALLAVLALPVLAVLGLGLRARLGAVLGLVALYVPLAGAGPSIQRAGVMGAVAIVALLAGRPAQRWYALGLAAAATLLWAPEAAGDPGWQLSFAATAAILALAPPVATYLGDRRVPGPLAQATALTVAAGLGTAPLLALHFGEVSLVSLPVNVIAAPVVAAIMWLGFAAGGLGLLAPAAGELVAVAAAPLLGFLGGLAGAAAGVPYARAAVGLGAAAAAGVYAALAAAVLVPRLRGVLLAATALAAGWAILGPRLPPPAPPPGPRIVFLDVGQGDATLLQAGSRAILVDAGPPDGPVLERLRAAGVRRLDAAVVTHASADHDGAMARVLRALPVGALVDGDPTSRTSGHAALLRSARARGLRPLRGAAGQLVRAGPIRLRVLWPPLHPPRPPGDDPNLWALVAEAELPGLRALLTADAESPVTLGLPLRRVDVLKVAHHGSADAGLPELLARLRPRTAVVPVGPNPYGHPAPATLAALRRAVPHVRRTDEGSVAVAAPGSP